MYFANKLAFELCIQLWHIVVPLRLEKVASDQLQVVLLCKLVDRKVAAARTRAACQSCLIETQFAALFVDQNHVAMQAGSLGRAGTNVRRQSVTVLYVGSGNIDDQPVVPLSKLGIAAARGVRVCHADAVEGAWVRLPVQRWGVLYLGGCQLVAKIYLLAALILYDQHLPGEFWYHVGDDFGFLHCFNCDNLKGNERRLLRWFKSVEFNKQSTRCLDTTALSVLLGIGKGGDQEKEARSHIYDSSEMGIREEIG